MPVTIVPIADVSPRVAVGALGTESPYFAPGYLVQSPAHPLHNAVYREDPDETHGFRCDEPRAIGGRVDFTPGFGTVIGVKGLDEASVSLLRRYDNIVFVDAQTEYVGLNRDGSRTSRRASRFRSWFPRAREAAARASSSSRA